MHPRTIARILFTLLITALAAAVALAVGQLPETWRIAMVTWLLVGLPLLLLGGRVALRAARYRAAHPRNDAPQRSCRAGSARSTPGALRVVLSDSAGSGRYVIR